MLFRGILWRLKNNQNNLVYCNKKTMNEKELIKLIELSQDIRGCNDFEIGLTGNYFINLKREINEYLVHEKGEAEYSCNGGFSIKRNPKEFFLYMGISVLNLGGNYNGYVVTDKEVMS